MKYGLKFYSKAAYDLKRELTKHPLFKLSNMNNEYNETRGNGTKWSCQNEIKSKSNIKSKTRLLVKTRFKRTFRLFMSLSTLVSQLLMCYFLFLGSTHCYKKSPQLIDLLSVLHVRDFCLFFYSLLVQDTSVYPPKI